MLKKKLMCLWTVAAFIAFMGFHVIAFAGDLESPAAPTDAASAMFTIEDIYNLLDTGAIPTKRSGAFTEPGAAPGDTGHTLDDLKALIDSRAHATCNGTLNGTRWCDNGDGTVTDLTTGLVWLQNANCFVPKKWANKVVAIPTTWDDAQTACGILKSGFFCALTDGSIEEVWRLPTLTELKQIISGTEPVDSYNQRSFTGVQSSYYWSSTTTAISTALTWVVDFGFSNVLIGSKSELYHVWCVRGGP